MRNLAFSALDPLPSATALVLPEAILLLLDEGSDEELLLSVGMPRVSNS